MNADLDLEQRYRRALRLLPGYYRDRWEVIKPFQVTSMTCRDDEDRGTVMMAEPSSPVTS